VKGPGWRLSFTLTSVRQQMSDSTFVVGVGDIDAAERLAGVLAEVGQVQRVDATLYLLVTLDDGQGSDSDWRRIVAEVGESGWVSPAVVDRRGTISVPTGEVSVRFEDNPTDDLLSQFASEHGLALKRRSPTVPEQVVFEPERLTERFLPDLVSELDTRADVQQAWANTLSRPRRGG
jgi:hypothetical protein